MSTTSRLVPGGEPLWPRLQPSPTSPNRLGSRIDRGGIRQGAEAAGASSTSLWVEAICRDGGYYRLRHLLIQDRCVFAARIDAFGLTAIAAG